MKGLCYFGKNLTLLVSHLIKNNSSKLTIKTSTVSYLSNTHTQLNILCKTLPIFCICMLKSHMKIELST